MLRRSLFTVIGGLLASAHQALGKIIERIPAEPALEKSGYPDVEVVPTECHINLKWPGTRLTVHGTGYLCIVDVNGTQWSQMHIEPGSDGKVVYGDTLTDKQGRRYRDVAGAETGLKMLIRGGVREGVSSDEFPPLVEPRKNALYYEGVFRKVAESGDEWTATMLVTQNRIYPDKANAIWKEKHGRHLIQ